LNEEDSSDSLSDSSITLTASNLLPNEPQTIGNDVTDSDEESETASVDSDETCMEKTFSVMAQPSEYLPNINIDKLTLPILTKYEKVKVLAFRASQICQNSPIYANIEPE